MSAPALLCTDGSDLSVDALAAGLAVLDPRLVPVLVTVIEASDPSLVTGTGFAGGVLTPEELAAEDKARTDEAIEMLTGVGARLGIASAEHRVLVGSAGHAICGAAAETDAAVVVIGSRGRSGLQRAVLGSVSDHVVRHAPCPVLVTAPD